MGVQGFRLSIYACDIDCVRFMNVIGREEGGGDKIHSQNLVLENHPC